MLNKRVGLILVVLLFAGFIGCKKENKHLDQNNQNNSQRHHGPNYPSNIGFSCSTVPDCKIVGRYHVIASYLNGGCGNQPFDTIYGYTHITITEASPGVIQFGGDSINQIQFTAGCDTSALYGQNTTLFQSVLPLQNGNNAGTTIILYGNDSITVNYYSGASHCGFSYSWYGTKDH